MIILLHRPPHVVAVVVVVVVVLALSHRKNPVRGHRTGSNIYGVENNSGNINTINTQNKLIISYTPDSTE